MSLVRIAVRIAGVEALKGRTIVGSNVLDSEIGSLQVDASGNMRTEEDTPFITVYTDGGSTKGMDNSVRSFSLNGLTDILFEAGITAAMTETDPNTDASTLVGIGIPATDRAFEFHLDLVSRQIGDCLTDTENEWGQIFMALIMRTVMVERARTSGASEGMRLAGHQIKLSVELVAEPLKGMPVKLESPMGKFFAKAAASGDPVIEAQVAMMQAQLSGEPYSWQSMQRRHGMTDGEMGSLLLTPPDNADGDVAIADIDAQPAEVSN